MKHKYRYSERNEPGKRIVTPTDVKQFVFCPRVTYFTRVVRLKPIMGSQQEDAKKSHELLSDLEKRRKSIMKSDLPFDFRTKEFDIPLQSNRLGVHGRLDMLIETTDSELIPVEFKVMKSNRGGVRMDHKYQLSTLALLIEETEDIIVRRGVVHYMLEPTSIQVSFTEGVKRRTMYYINQIKKIFQQGTVPRPRPECSKGRVGCGFADFCRDF